jgi:signal transduction histidine kinase/ligand-binding sensor domain-containing protein
MFHLAGWVVYTADTGLGIGPLLRLRHSSLPVTRSELPPRGQTVWRRFGLALACLFILLLPTAAPALDPTRSIVQFHHTKWDISDSIPANIWAIAQTRDGYLWLGSVNGLYRFDGVHVERIAADRLPSPSVHALAATKSGGLWIGYERPVGVISLLQNGALTNFPVDAPFSTSVHNILIGPNKTVWASTSETILRFDGKRWQAMESHWGTSFGEGPGGVWNFGVARDGTVWSKNLNGLFYLKPGSSRFSEARGYSGGAEGFTTTPDGRLWTTDSKVGFLYALPDLKGVTGDAVPAPARGMSVPRSLRGPILLDRDGTFWCVSFSDGGLCRVSAPSTGAASQRVSSRFRAKDGLSSDLVHTLFEDREGNIWVGTNLGLDRFRAANIVTERRVPVGFRARFVQASSTALYAYTGWSNTASRETDGSETLYRILPHGAPEIFVRNVGRLRGMDVDDRTGAMWLATQKGMQRLQNGGLAAPIALPAGVTGGMVFSAVHDKRGTLWMSVFGRGVFHQEQGVWISVPVRSKVGATAVLIPDADDGVWVRYSGGSLFRVTGERIQDFSNNGLNIGDVTFIQAADRGLIIGGESGIGRVENGKFYALHAADIPALSGVTGIAQTKDGSTWVFTQAGILRVATKTLNSALRRSDPGAFKFELFDSRDGLPGAPYGALYGSTAATDLADRVWFTTGNGLVWIDPNNLHHNRLPPNVIVRSVTAANTRYDFPVDLHLAAGTSNLEIDYADLSLTMPERNHYKYKLEGVDDGWVDPGSRRQAFYTNVRPGNYKFRVIASNNDGVWNTTGATLEFSIAPTFWQTRWFLALIALAILLLFGVIYQVRVMQLKRRAALARESDERQREMLTQLARANRLATMGQLTASIAHEVKNPIAASVTNAQAAQRWLAADPPNLNEAREALEGIATAGMTAGDVIDRIRAFVRNQPPKKEALDINEKIRAVLVLTHTEAVKNGVRVTTELAPNLPPVEGDRVQIQQVLLNLIMNAIEAMSSVEGGRRELLIQSHTGEAGGVVVEVRDAGPGLPPDGLDVLFDAFYTTKPTGLGMGLSISRSIVEAHGGKLMAGANEPRGAIFRFSVPAINDAQN